MRGLGPALALLVLACLALSDASRLRDGRDHDVSLPTLARPVERKDSLLSLPNDSNTEHRPFSDTAKRRRRMVARGKEDERKDGRPSLPDPEEDAKGVKKDEDGAPSFSAGSIVFFAGIASILGFVVFKGVAGAAGGGPAATGTGTGTGRTFRTPTPHPAARHGAEDDGPSFSERFCSCFSQLIPSRTAADRAPVGQRQSSVLASSAAPNATSNAAAAASAPGSAAKGGRATMNKRRSQMLTGKEGPASAEEDDDDGSGLPLPQGVGGPGGVMHKQGSRLSITNPFGDRPGQQGLKLGPRMSSVNAVPGGGGARGSVASVPPGGGPRASGTAAGVAAAAAAAGYNHPHNPLLHPHAHHGPHAHHHHHHSTNAGQFGGSNAGNNNGDLGLGSGSGASAAAPPPPPSAASRTTTSSSRLSQNSVNNSSKLPPLQGVSAREWIARRRAERVAAANGGRLSNSSVSSSFTAGGSFSASALGSPTSGSRGSSGGGGGGGGGVGGGSSSAKLPSSAVAQVNPFVSASRQRMELDSANAAAAGVGGMGMGLGMGMGTHDDSGTGTLSPPMSIGSGGSDAGSVGSGDISLGSAGPQPYRGSRLGPNGGGGPGGRGSGVVIRKRIGSSAPHGSLVSNWTSAKDVMKEGVKAVVQQVLQPSSPLSSPSRHSGSNSGASGASGVVTGAARKIAMENEAAAGSASAAGGFQPSLSIPATSTEGVGAAGDLTTPSRRAPPPPPRSPSVSRGRRASLQDGTAVPTAPPRPGGSRSPSSSTRDYVG